MSSPPVRSDPRDRIVSVALAVLILVIAVPLGALLVAKSLHRQMSFELVLLLVPPAVLTILAAAILHGYWRGRVFAWLSGGWRTSSLLLLLALLAGMLKALLKVVEKAMTRAWGISPAGADLVGAGAVVAGLALFAVYWRRASSAHRRATGRETANMDRGS